MASRVLRAESSVLLESLHPQHAVLAVGRARSAKKSDPSTELLPFRLLVRSDTGQERVDTADVVLDCTGTFGRPNWVSWHLSTEWYGSLARLDTFRADPQVPPDWYRVQGFDFSGSGFDRGHMVPNADRDKETSIPINQATFLMTNMVAQAPGNNQGPWADLESELRLIADQANELYVISGPEGAGGTGLQGVVTMTIAGGRVTVASNTWKVALVLPKMDGDDISRVTCTTRTIAVVMPNTQGIRTNDWRIYRVSVDTVEALSGNNFFSNVPVQIQNAIEKRADIVP